MNREIKFRGIPINTDIQDCKENWNDCFVYGFLISDKGGDLYIVEKNSFDFFDDYIQVFGFEEEDFTCVIPETVGIYIEEKDKNGKEIYKGDIIKEKRECYKCKDIIYEVIYENGSFILYNKGNHSKKLFSEVYKTDIEVIGNIYENPELLNK